MSDPNHRAHVISVVEMLTDPEVCGSWDRYCIAAMFEEVLTLLEEQEGD